jgi:hypothetical protein
MGPACLIIHQAGIRTYTCIYASSMRMHGPVISTYITLTSWLIYSTYIEFYRKEVRNTILA